MKNMKIVKLLALVTLLAGCSLFLEPETILKNGENEVSQVMITINGNARTIMPNIDDTPISKVIISAEPAAGNTQSAPEPVEITVPENPEGQELPELFINVPYGNWIISVTLCLNKDGIDYPGAKGSAPLTVNSNHHSLTIIVAMPEAGTGTFTYNVHFPANGTAAIKLATPDGKTIVVNNGSVVNGTKTGVDIPSGFYFLTVTAIVEGKTITRNEVVHIYPYLSTDALYVFSKLDFGATSLNLSGTVKVLIDGKQPDQASVNCSILNSHDYNSSSGSYNIPINFTGSDGTGTWSLNISNLRGGNTINFRLGGIFGYGLSSIVVPVDDKTGINLGTAVINTIPLAPDTWVDGNITTSGDTVDWYSIEVTAGQTYYFWFNNQNGDGSKTLDGYIDLYYNNGNQQYTNFAWYAPISFTANYNGTAYIKIRTSDWNRAGGTYAIGCSTKPFMRANPVPLAPDTWVDGRISGSLTEDWYSIEVTEGETYNFWWNDYYDGDGTKSLDIDVYAYYYSNGNYIFGADSAWSNPRSFTANKNDTVYIRVRAYGGWNSSTGTYAIKYSYE